MELTRRSFILVVSFACCFLLFLVSYADHRFGTNLGFSWFNQEPILPSRGYLVDTPGCQMPNWDPMDASISKLINKNHLPYICSLHTSFLVIGPNATLRLDANILERLYQYTADSIQCRYKAILRDPGKVDRPTDNEFVFGPVTNVTFDQPLGAEFMHVHCSQGGRDFHDEFLALTPLKPAVEKRCVDAEASTINQKDTKSIPKEKLNVIMLGVDSISKLNFIRHFPRTRKFLRQKLKAIELHGYNKVADNTFPNLVPMLTGQFIAYYWNETKKDMFFDDIDLVWRKYADRGYRTLMAEDAPKIATFNYLRKGFKDPPTDYYLRPFMLATETSLMRKRSKEDCFDDRMELKVIFDYVKSFVDTMDTRPFFSFSFAARLTHDVLNKAGKADFPSFKILSHLHERNVTNNSLIIFMSDHGIRFGPIRETYIGKFEERWPIMFLVFPDWFYKKYPEVTRNLQTNQKRLTTPFDIHETLKALVDFTGLPNNNVSLTNRGISLFDEIPTERTCSDAAILPHWCTCQRLTPVLANSSEVRVAAVALVKALNDFLSNHSQLCAKLTLDEVRDAHMGQPNDEVLKFQRNVHDVINNHVEYGPRVNAPADYLVSLKTKPSGAIFEGTIRVDHVRGVRQVLGDVSRINMYGHQGDCLQDANLRKFCYCKTQLVVS